MRYSNDEQTVLVGIMKPGVDVTIKVMDLISGNLINITTDACPETQLEGVYRWPTSNIDDEALADGFYNLFYEMVGSDGKKFYGKFLYGGYVDKDVVVDLGEMDDDHKEIQETLDVLVALQ